MIAKLWAASKPGFTHSPLERSTVRSISRKQPLALATFLTISRRHLPIAIGSLSRGNNRCNYDNSPEQENPSHHPRLIMEFSQVHSIYWSFHLPFLEMNTRLQMHVLVLAMLPIVNG